MDTEQKEKLAAAKKKLRKFQQKAVRLQSVSLSSYVLTSTLLASSYYHINSDILKSEIPNEC